MDPDKEAGPHLQRFCPLVSRHGGHVLRGEELAARALCCLHRRGPGGDNGGVGPPSHSGGPPLYTSPPHRLRTDPTNTVNSKSRGQASASSPSPQGQLPSQPESPTRDPSITMVRCHVKSPTESPPGQQGSGQQGETEHPDQARELRPEDIPVYGRTHRGRYHYRHRSHTRRRPYRRRRRRACRHRRRRRGAAGPPCAPIPGTPQASRPGLRWAAGGSCSSGAPPCQTAPSSCAPSPPRFPGWPRNWNFFQKAAEG